jgi:hypothetical protein
VRKPGQAIVVLRGSEKQLFTQGETLRRAVEPDFVQCIIG